MSGKYQTFEPGKYFDWEKKAVEERFENARKGPPKGREKLPKPISEYEILNFNGIWDPYNPLFNDPDYAKSAGWKDVFARPCIKLPMGAISMVGEMMGTGDLFYYSNSPTYAEFGAPIYPGDTFTVENEKLIFEDITIPGADYRWFKFSAITNMYNQRDELVVRHTLWRREAYRKIIDGSPKPSFTENQSEWVKDFPPAHYTTDEEWEYVRELWSKEYIRGKDTLYWEDVNIGDEPAWVTSGPVSYMDEVRWQGSLGGNQGYLLHDDGGPILGGWKYRDLMFRDIYGIYLPLTANHYGGRNIPGARMVFFNNTAAYIIARLVTNYIGDAGFVTKMGWVFQQFSKHMQFEREGGEYLDKVPYMKGRGCDVHPSEGDTVIGKGYVTDKYIDEKGDYIIDLVCWGENLDNQVIQVVTMSAKLPSKER